MTVFTLPEKIFIVKRYYQTGNSTKQVENEFLNEFQSDQTLNVDIITQLVDLFEKFGNVAPENIELKFAVVDTLENQTFTDDYIITESEEYLDESNVLSFDEEHDFIENDCEKDEHLNNKEPRIATVLSKIEESSSCKLKATIRCEICDKIFNRRTEKIKHMIGHKNTCDICGKKARNLASHMQKHTGEKAYKCTQCNAQFATSMRLKNHLASHSNDRPYKCNVCPKSFKTNSQMCGHKKTHLTDRPIKCELCGKGFLRNREKNAHMRTHTGEKTAVCNYCGKSFSTSDFLKQHIRTHTGEKPYKCKFCDKQFTYSHVLKIHERVHTGEKPYNCIFCEKKFSDNSSCKSHERTHTGNYPYICKICNKAHNHPSNLKSHMRHAHRQEDLKML